MLKTGYGERAQQLNPLPWIWPPRGSIPYIPYGPSNTAKGDS